MRKPRDLDKYADVEGAICFYFSRIASILRRSRQAPQMLFKVNVNESYWDPEWGKKKTKKKTAKKAKAKR